LTPDPLGGFAAVPQSVNKYVYALNNPATFVDPSGLFSIKGAFKSAVKGAKALGKGAASIGKTVLTTPGLGTGIRVGVAIGTAVGGAALAGAITVATGNPVLGAVVGGFVAGAVNSLIQTGFDCVAYGCEGLTLGDVL
jgi:hypothetical protein